MKTSIEPSKNTYTPNHVANDSEATTATTSDATSTPKPTEAAASFMRLPPTDANIPVPPAGFIPTNGTDYRALLPRRVEIIVLADVVRELESLTDYSEIFGRTLPPRDTATQILDAAEKWSTMRNAATLWDLYCRTQEGIAWHAARGLVAKMKSSFRLAVDTNASLGTEHPALVTFLGARAEIAKRAVATRKANREAELQGKPPTKGKARKKEAKIAKLVAAYQAKAAAASESSKE